MKSLFRIKSIVWVLVASLGPVALDAAPVTVGDPSFEGNALAPSGYSYDLSPEWQETGGPGNGSGFEEYITGFAAEGTDHLGMEGGHDVWQDLAVTYQANTRYTLTVAAGNRNGATQTGNETRYVLADSTGTIYATGSWDASANVAADSFADAPALVFDTPNNPAAVGKTLRILLQARGNGRSHFDNIRLDAASFTVPGAATLGALSATAVTATGATLSGSVTDIGTDAPVVTVFWGTGDGGIVAGNWQHSVTLAGTQSGVFSTGISALSPAGTYYFTVRATNTSGDAWVSPSADFETLALAPTVVTTAASNVSANTATLGADVTSTGGENPAVTVYYGTADGGTNAGAWASSVNLGTGSGPLSAGVSGLLPVTGYFFRAYAQNSAGGSWAAGSLGFTTTPVATPTVENRNPEGITGTTANLRGEITDPGTSTPTVTLFYGTTDGGTSPGAWTFSAALGAQTGEFTHFVAGLSATTPYFFRFRAVNNAGTVWSATSDTFTTTGLVPSTAVINEFHYNALDATSFEEFIELHNPGDTAIDLSGWTISNAVDFTFPAGTTLPAGGYKVVAENPTVLQGKFAITGVLGPWTGKLSSKGERIELRDAAGVLKDSVTYGAGFPWPTTADGAGPSAELIHPSLDNDLGGSWRSSYNPGSTGSTYIAQSSTGWTYFKGISAPPVNSSDGLLWNTVAYNSSNWTSWITGGAMPLGYNSKYGNVTLIPDMQKTTTAPIQAGYWSVYLRNTFTLPANQIPDSLTLKLFVDDGCIVWINGVEVKRYSMPAGTVNYNTAATNHDASIWETFTLTNASSYLKGGTNVIAIEVHNSSLTSSDLTVNTELSASIAASSNPSPGKANGSLLATNLVPPQIRQVANTPKSPTPNTPVAITARITDPDGTGAVSLAYQTVDPGSYIRKTDAAYSSSWTTVSMVDNGSNGDAVAGDSTFTAVLPASVQTHRRLVRYKITFADALGNLQTVPYADDEQPNFAYFVYAGTPAWNGAFIPGSTTLQTYASPLLESLPPLHVLANAADISSFLTGNATRYYATVIHRGIVYDHVQYRVRGIGSVGQSGKEKWNIYFNRARDYQAYDNLGNPYKETWNNLLINANASPWAAVNRGSAGIEEAASNRIFSLAGMAAMNTHYLHLRVIDDAAESGATQYDGDLWGLHLGLEPTEGNFLDERGLPDGNLYSIEGSGGDKKHQGATQVVDSSDWTNFNNAANLTGQSEQWYRDNVDLPSLYTFLALNRLIGNVDVRPGDNYRFYHRSSDNRWVIIPYDLDMQFIAAHHWGGTMDGVVVAGAPNVIRAISRWPNLAREYRNRCRELLSLMASDGTTTGGQIGQLFDEYAQIVNPTGVALTWADLDAAMWNRNPKTKGSLGATTGQSNHLGNFYRATYYDGSRGAGGTVSTTSWIRSLPDPDGNGYGDHEGLTQWFVNFATNTWPGGTWNRKAMTGIGTGADTDINRQKGYGYKYLEFESLYGGWVNSTINPSTAANNDYPNKPVVTATGNPAFPVDDLTFTSSAFSDPQGAGTYSAWQWRLAEIYAPGVSGYVAGTPRKYEIEPLLTSAELATAPGSFTIPLGVAETGRTYRVRTRYKDSSGNWSYWSEPVQFGATAAPPGVLVHYWNFNTPASQLVPTQTTGGGAMAVAGTYLSGTGQDFAALNARNGDPAGAHLRVNDPLTVGTMVTAAIPTTGFENIIVKYETRRSGQGAGIQNISYTLDGSAYTAFTTFTILDDVPVVRVLDFRPLTGANNNPLFGIRITFTQGAGGTAGNNRFDNLTVEADALPGLPELVPGGDADWNIASNWASVSVPNSVGALAIIHAPASANRAVTLTAPITIGTMEMDNAASGFLNQITGTAGTVLTFNGDTSPALLDVDGTGTGYIEFDIPGGTTLASDLRLDVSNIEGDPAHGALRLREAWEGPGGLIKQGPGIASLTGIGKTFTGAVNIEQGVLQVSQPSTPAQSSGTTVHAGGQLRLTSGNDINGPRIHTFGGAIVLAGTGRGAGVPNSEPYGVAGALRYDPDITGTNRAIVTNGVTLSANAEVHTDGADNTLELTGTLGGAGNLTKSGAGALVLSGASPSFANPVLVSNGPLEANGNLPLAPVQLSSGTILRGSGKVGAITGSGTVAPHLATLTVPSSAAGDYDFVLAATGSAGNSILRLTDSAPLPTVPATVDLFINIATRVPGDRILGGFFTIPSFDLAAALAGTQIRLLVPDAAGSISHLGVNYRLALSADNLTWSVADRSHDFGSGMIAGRTLEIFVGGTPTQFTQWRNLNFPTDFANDAISGPNANPSGDGIPNLIRYAHGAGPYDPVIALLPALVKNGGGFDFRFRYDSTKTDLIWRVRASDDLGDWSHVLFDSQTGPIPPLDNGWLPVPLPDHLGAGPATDPEMFTRLQVELAD